MSTIKRGKEGSLDVSLLKISSCVGRSLSQCFFCKILHWCRTVCKRVYGGFYFIKGYRAFNHIPACLVKFRYQRQHLFNVGLIIYKYRFPENFSIELLKLFCNSSWHQYTAFVAYFYDLF